MGAWIETQTHIVYVEKQMPLLDNIVRFPTLIGVQRTYNFDFILPDIYGIGISGVVVSKYCQACRFGQYDIEEVIELKSGVHKQFFPGAMDFGPVTATFICPVPDLVMLYFIRWKKMIVDDNGFYYPSKNYKKNIYVILYDRTGIPTNFIQLKGAFPVRFPGYNLSYAGEDVVRYDVEFRVDRIRMGTKALYEMGTVGRVVTEAIRRVPGVIKSVGESIGGRGHKES